MLQCELERVSLAAYWTNRGGTRLGNLIIFALFLNLFCWHCGLNFLCEGFSFFIDKSREFQKGFIFVQGGVFEELLRLFETI